ncbi:hypothetical protein niasHT_022105 [Heterodera trifolii]|uniref:Uncharacterized protein n=1 Tax=Heterodera trifolii TaxID=157864 RepID=A0ABD2KNM5_9BILA
MHRHNVFFQLQGQPRGMQQQQQAQQPQIAYLSYPQQQSRGGLAPQMGGGASGGGANAGHLLLGDENMLRLRVDEAQQCFTRPRGRRRRSRMNEAEGWMNKLMKPALQKLAGLAPSAHFPLSSFQSPGLNPPHPNSRESTHQHFNHRDSTHHIPITNLNILDITEFVHKNNVKNSEDSCWLQNLRIYFNSNERDPLKSCFIKMDKAEFFYGLEYLGIQEKLVQTPLTDR